MVGRRSGFSLARQQLRSLWLSSGGSILLNSRCRGLRYSYRWIIIFEIPMLYGTQERQKERAPYLAAFIRAMLAGMFSCAGWIAGLLQK